MYTYPFAVINHVTYTALRWGQFPTITYDTSNEDVTAGHEIVQVADDLSDITIFIEDGVSTNANIKAAILASDTTVQSLYARNLISAVIAGGHTADTNTDVSATDLTGAVSVPAPSEAAPVIPIVSTDPLNPDEGRPWYNATDHVLRFFDGTEVQTVQVDS